MSPEKAFDHRWALTLLSQVLSRLEGEFAASNKSPLFAELTGLLSDQETENRSQTSEVRIQRGWRVKKVRRSAKLQFAREKREVKLSGACKAGWGGVRLTRVRAVRNGGKSPYAWTMAPKRSPSSSTSARKVVAVGVDPENGFAFVAASGHVVAAAGALNRVMGATCAAVLC